MEGEIQTAFKNVTEAVKSQRQSILKLLTRETLGENAIIYNSGRDSLGIF
jgi:hypothetical protein